MKVMKKKVFCILLSLICFSLSAQQRIIGGYTVDISDRPFQAFVACNNGNRYNVGGGVIISPQWILTAAHVVT